MPVVPDVSPKDPLTDMKLKNLTAALCLSLASLSLPAFAAMPDAPAVPGTEASQPSPHKWREKCAADPQKCEEMKKHREARKAECAADPAKCKEHRRAHRKHRHEKCKADADCKAKLDQHKAKREERKAACAADPAKCKAEREQRRAAHKARCEADADCKARMDKRRAAREERCNKDPSQCTPPRKPWEGTGTAPSAPR